jgi:hypothetical protein
MQHVDDVGDGELVLPAEGSLATGLPAASRKQLQHVLDPQFFFDHGSV